MLEVLGDQACFQLHFDADLTGAFAVGNQPSFAAAPIEKLDVSSHLHSHGGRRWKINATPGWFQLFQLEGCRGVLLRQWVVGSPCLSGFF